MGRRTEMKTPRYVHGYIDRHGKARWYFRRRGFKKVPLPGLPWSPEFMAAHEQALAGHPVEIGSKRTRPGTIRALAVSYFNSITFRSLRPSSQEVYRFLIDRFCREVGANGAAYGDMPAATMKREHIVKLMTQRANKPDSANGLRKVLRAMMQHAVETGIRQDDPTRDVKAIRVKTTGIHSWTDDEIKQFEAKYSVGTRERLAFALLLGTGQRVSDIVAMGRQHIRGDYIHVRQVKTGAELDIPILPELAAILADSPANNLTFITTKFGKPFTANWFSDWFCGICKEAGLPQWPEKSSRASIGRGRLHGARNRGHHRTCEPARSDAIHEGGRSTAACCGRNSQDKNQNIQWLTRRKVSQLGRKPS
jgi:integrase